MVACCGIYDACRLDGSTTPFWWDATISPELADYNGKYAYGDGPTGEDRGRTLPVDSFQANPWGLYQVHGNVNEWTLDCWHQDYVGAPSDGSAWTSGNCEFRVGRGGSWYSFPALLRTARRNRDFTDLRSILVGFRVARTLTSSPSTRRACRCASWGSMPRLRLPRIPSLALARARKALNKGQMSMLR
jgi:formylglycine-generating enzyme required for sulfatase activity